MDPILAIVIGTLDRLDQLQRGIQSIIKETSIPWRIYVTDAGSTDGTLEYLQALNDPRIVPVLEGKRLGQATAYNRVFRTLREPYVCWLSDDNEIINHGLDVAVGILARSPAIGLVGLKVRDVLGPFVKAPYIGGVSPLGVLNVNQGVLRTHDLLAIGGFSEWFQNYGIDPDVTTNVLLQGLDVVYTREVAILHHRNWPADTNTPEFQRVMDKQKEAGAKYLQKFCGVFPPDGAWERKKAAWDRWKKRFPALAGINSHTPVHGRVPRDWHNVMMARFISLRELFSRQDAYHLRQHLPKHLRPATLPADPVAPVTASPSSS